MMPAPTLILLLLGVTNLNAFITNSEKCIKSCVTQKSCDYGLYGMEVYCKENENFHKEKCFTTCGKTYEDINCKETTFSELNSFENVIRKFDHIKLLGESRDENMSDKFRQFFQTWISIKPLAENKDDTLDNAFNEGAGNMYILGPNGGLSRIRRSTGENGGNGLTDVGGKFTRSYKDLGELLDRNAASVAVLSGKGQDGLVAGQPRAG